MRGLGLKRSCPVRFLIPVRSIFFKAITVVTKKITSVKTSLVNRPGKLVLPLFVTLLANGCAYFPHTPLVPGTTTAAPAPAAPPVPNGSIFQSVQPMNYGYQPLFEDRRPRR